MNQALWLLLGLQMRGWLRYLARGMRSLRGLLLLLVGVSVFGFWLLAVLTGPSTGRVGPEQLGRYGPAVLVAYCLLNVLFSPSDRALYFTPAEVQFLFAGPFTRRSVLIYKILLSLLVSLPPTLFMGAILRLKDAWLPAVLAGLFLIATFMQLFTMALGLLASGVGARLYTRGRVLAVCVAGAGLFAILLEAGRQSGWQWRRLGDRVFDTTLWQVATWPLRSYFDVMSASQFWPDLLVPLAVGLGTLAVLVGLVLALEAHYQEASAAASARRYAAIQRVRGRSVGAEPPGKTRERWLGLPTLPYWGGVGPVLWRQLTSAFRGLGRLVFVFGILGSLVSLLLVQSISESEDMLVWALFMVIAWLSIFLTPLVPYDFRGDLDRIALLKSLPVVPWRLTLGQLLTPTLLLCVVQWLALVALAVVSPGQASMLALWGTLVPPFNFVLVGLDNLLFLLFPVRVMATTPGDFQGLGRNVLLSLGKILGLLAIAGLTVSMAAVAWALSTSMIVALLVAWPVLLGSGLALVPLIALAFRNFDVGRDVPA